MGVINLDMPMLLYDFGDVIAFGAAHSSLGESVQQAADEAGGVIDHRNDAGIIQTRRANDAEYADDLLLIVLERRDDQGRTRHREQGILRADEDPHAFAFLCRVEEIDDPLLAFKLVKEPLDTFEIIPRRGEQFRLALHDQLRAAARPFGQIGNPLPDKIRRQLIKLPALLIDLTKYRRGRLGQGPARHLGVEKICRLNERGRRQPFGH